MQAPRTELPAPLRKPGIGYVTLGVSLLCHALALYLYGQIHGIPNTLTEQELQFFSLAALSAGLAVAMFVVARLGLYRLLLAMRFGLYLALCYRFRYWLEVRLVLATALLFETGVYQPFPENLCTQLGMLGTAVVVFDLLQPLPEEIAPDRLRILFQFALYPLLGGLASSFLTLYRERAIREQLHAERLDDAVSELSASNTRLQQLAFRAEVSSRATERRKIARDLHDTVGYTLTNLVMMMEAATDVAQRDQQELESIMQAARDQARAGLEETRRALRELRDREEEAPTGIRAVERLVRAFDKVSTVRVSAQYGNAPVSFGEKVDGALYHFVQEGLTNAVRHGKATRIRILFWLDDGRLTVTISDNGRGAESIQEGMGLTGMREHMARLGGELGARNVPGGFELRMRVPLGSSARA